MCAIRYGAQALNQRLDRDLFRISLDSVWRGAWVVLGSYNEVVLASYNSGLYGALFWDGFKALAGALGIKTASYML